jgi:hypothetical protein
VTKKKRKREIKLREEEKAGKTYFLRHSPTEFEDL